MAPRAENYIPVELDAKAQDADKIYLTLIQKGHRRHYRPVHACEIIRPPAL